MKPTAQFSLMEILVKPMLATLGMAAAVGIVWMALHSVNGWILFLCATAVGIVVYFALVVGFHIVTTEDLRMLPGGIKLDSWLREKRIWRDI